MRVVVVGHSRDAGRVVEAQVKGQEIIVTHGLQAVSLAEAGLMIRMVGAHHRMAVEDAEAWHAAERKRRHQSLQRFFALENELGLTE